MLSWARSFRLVKPILKVSGHNLHLLEKEGNLFGTENGTRVGCNTHQASGTDVAHISVVMRCRPLMHHYVQAYLMDQR